MARTSLKRLVIGPVDLGIPRVILRIAAAFFIVAILAAVVDDIVRGPSGAEAAWTDPAEVHPFRGDLVLEQVKYDALRRTITADVSITITGRAPEASIERASFRLTRNAQGGIDLLSSNDCTLAEEGMEADGGQTVPSKRFSCGTLTFGHSPGLGERAYPFDGYSVALVASGCVNQRECLENQINLGFKTVTARAAQPTLLPALRTTDGLVLLLGRRPFIKYLAIVLAVMSALFFVLLTRVGEPRDLFAKSLGFYGTLWALRSLIVPSSVSAFPTYVDYFVLTVFSITFAVMLGRLSAEGAAK